MLQIAILEVTASHWQEMVATQEVANKMVRATLVETTTTMQHQQIWQS